MEKPKRPADNEREVQIGPNQIVNIADVIGLPKLLECFFDSWIGQRANLRDFLNSDGHFRTSIYTILTKIWVAQTFLSVGEETRMSVPPQTLANKRPRQRGRDCAHPLLGYSFYPVYPLY